MRLAPLVEPGLPDALRRTPPATPVCMALSTVPRDMVDDMMRQVNVPSELMAMYRDLQSITNEFYLGSLILRSLSSICTSDGFEREIFAVSYCAPNLARTYRFDPSTQHVTQWKGELLEWIGTAGDFFAARVVDDVAWKRESTALWTSKFVRGRLVPTPDLTDDDGSEP